MKKKILATLLATIMVLSLAACEGGGKDSSSDAETKEAKEPADLTGTWKSEDNEGSWMEAVISSDVMEINWVSDDGDTKSVYWIGTYTAPQEYAEQYSWTSERDKEKTDLELLASTDDTKDFTYKDEKISYEASAMGTTTTVELTKEQ